VSLADLSGPEDPLSARLPDRDIALLLSSSIGLDKAQECVSDAIRALGFLPTGLTRQEALAVLEHVAMQPGLVGVTARFAKSRIHLKWSVRPSSR
jgi:hypothetical protein